METGRYNVLLMSASFFFIMGGYSPTQNFATTLLDLPCLPLGSICIGLLYVVMAFASFVAPVFIRRMGPKRTMCIASLTYPLFIVSAVFIVSPLMVVLAVLIGLFAALLNTAQGALQTDCCNDSNRGLHNGIFTAFNQGAGLIGNLAAIFLIKNSSDDADAAARHRCDEGGIALVVLGWQPRDSPFFLALAALSIVGCCLLTRLRPMPRAEAQDAETAGTAGAALRQTAALLFSPVMRDFVPLFLYTGLSQVFWSGMFTAELQDSEAIGVVMCILSVAEMAGGLLWGRAIDAMGDARRTAVLVLLTQLGALAVAWQATRAGAQIGLAYCAGALLGVADAGIFVVTFALITKRFVEGDAASAPPQHEHAATLLSPAATDEAGALKRAPAFSGADAFGVFFFTNSLLTGVGFFVIPLLRDDFLVETLFVAGFELFSVACLFFPASAVTAAAQGSATKQQQQQQQEQQGHGDGARRRRTSGALINTCNTSNTRS